MRKFRRYLVPAVLWSAAPLAHAHPGHEHADGFPAGLLHALTTSERGLMLTGVVLLIALLTGYFRSVERRAVAQRSMRVRHRHRR